MLGFDRRAPDRFSELVAYRSGLGHLPGLQMRPLRRTDTTDQAHDASWSRWPRRIERGGHGQQRLPETAGRDRPVLRFRTSGLSDDPSVYFFASRDGQAAACDGKYESVTDVDLASARVCAARICERWGPFQEARRRHLAGVSAELAPAEKVAENILCELFHRGAGLDDRAGTPAGAAGRPHAQRNGLKFLIVEVKRPGSFDGRGSILRALTQARGYAVELKVDRVAVSDGCVFEAYDLAPDGLRPRGRPPRRPGAGRGPVVAEYPGHLPYAPATVTVANAELADMSEATGR
jgi:hypothetical protein